MPGNGLGMQKLKKPCELTQGLCARFVQNVDFRREKIRGKSKGKTVFGKSRGRGPRKAAAEGKNNKKNGPRAALRGCFGLPELYRKAYNTDKPVLASVGRKP